MKQNATAEVLDQKPPSDPDAELMVLRELILKPDLIRTEDLSTDLFYEQAHVEIFRTIALLHEERQPTDLTHVWQRLHDEAKYDAIGGKAKIEAILTGDRLPSKFAVYLETLREKLALRKLLRLSENLAQNIHEMTTTEIIEWVQERIAAAKASLTGHATDAPITAGELIAKYPRLREPLIDGLLRRGETMNIIAAPKMGKSWLAYTLGLSVVMGWDWLGRLPCHPGRVLIFDNELDPTTLAHRLNTVADALGVRLDDYRNRLVLRPLRGKLLDLNGIAREVFAMKPGSYDLVIVDAFYRILPPGVSENDNAAIASMYNTIDALSDHLGAGWVNIHHTSKGSQGDKSITDVGAGAGSQSRAADAHLVLRQHEQDDAVVLDSVVRSFAPSDPIALRWNFPLWQADDSLDPSLLKGRTNKQKNGSEDRAAKDKILLELFNAPQSGSQLRKLTGAGKYRLDRLLDELEAADAITWEYTSGAGGKQKSYRLAEGCTETVV